MNYHKENPTIGRYEKFEYFYHKILKKKYTDKEKSFISDRFNRIVYEKVIASPFLPGSISFLKKYSKITPIWVVSGTPKNQLKKIIRSLNIDKYFDKIFSTPPDKSTILSSILKKTNIKPRSTIFIGDMNNDLIAAQDNKIPFIGVRGRKEFSGNRVYEIDNFLDIKNILTINSEQVVNLSI